MSDPESGSRSEDQYEPVSAPIFRSTSHREINLATFNLVQSFLPPDVDQTISHLPHPVPTHPENDESISIIVLERMHEKFNAAVPTRGDYARTWPTIYKVPLELKRGVEGECYEPVAARIGPFTGNNKGTVQLESYKWCCVRQLIFSWLQPSASQDIAEGQLDLWLTSMKRLEGEIRVSYSQDIEDDSDDLALNMLLDGCFILHRLLKHARREEKEAHGVEEDEKDEDWTQVFGRVCVWQLVTCDLLLLENQIPFFVLGELLSQLLGRTDKDALVKGSLRLFRSLCSHMLRGSASAIDFCDVPVHHLLHLFYLSIAGQAPTSIDKIKHSSQQAADVLPLERQQWIPCAKELEEAGIRFKKRNKATRFLDIEFDVHSGVLEIPPLQLDDFSDKLFRNLIAFEQTYPDTRGDFSSYAVFMDCLINTPEDMRILHLRGILVNQINGEQDASRFFSRICAQVYWSADKNYLTNVMSQVNTYRGSRLHKWRAALVRNYFSNPWVAMSVVAAVLLLAMTILQTTFTVYPYFKPPNN